MHPWHAGCDVLCCDVMSLSSDLLPLILWNEAHGIRLFRLSSCILPWMTSYQMEDLPDWPDIQLVRKQAAQSTSIRAEGGHGCSSLSLHGIHRWHKGPPDKFQWQRLCPGAGWMAGLCA
jgi:hypothetical protein